MKNLSKLLLISISLLLTKQNLSAMWDGENESKVVDSVKQKQIKTKEKELEATSSVFPKAQEKEIHIKKEETNALLCKSSLKEEKKVASVTAIPLTPSSSLVLNPGIYDSDDIELILTYPLENFGEEDIAIFDIDEVLLASLDSYYFEHFTKETALHRRLYSREDAIIDRFHLYLFLTKPCVLMDERLPSLLTQLQSKGVRCIANTATNPTVDVKLNVDIPNTRLRILKSLNLNFSTAFPNLLSWNFDTLEAKHAPNISPLFKNGVIFTAATPKPITTLELFKKLNIQPKKVAYVDDRPENVQEMYTTLSIQGIECYSFIYSKKNTRPIRSYFSESLFVQELNRLEAFLEGFLEVENVDEFFLSALQTG